MALRVPTTLPANRLSLGSRQYEFSVRGDDGRHTLKTSVTHCMPVTRPWHSPNVTRSLR
ncbi:hypothetical protein ARMGADRAFT_1008783 [Armillaria gallica]|uniref:Uncharacterized protein n=1 Tax=Armillaria gallica TaxID=47427 RepID=A0A2H3DT06_ARMGA|nr:hypothetical protein ARMGADRAFT_1008783 [Armillaria gallica]